MRAREFILEYERERAAQALGDALWKAALINDVDLAGRLDQDALKSFAVNRASTPAGKRVAQVLNDPAEQHALALHALSEIERADPSINKKYTQWMTRMFANGTEPALEDVASTLSDYVHKFHKLSIKKKLQPGENDINRYKSAKQLYLVMDRYDDPDEDESNKGKAEKVYEDGDCTIIVPRDEAAACRYGRRTRWCTAAVHGTNYFNQYNKDGPLYIIIPKNPKHEDEKYQLHFESSQFMDENDDAVNVADLLQRRFPGAGKMFMGNEQTKKMLMQTVAFTPDSVLEAIVQQIWEFVSEKVNDIVSDWESNDPSYYEWLKSEGYEDDQGNINWDDAPSYPEYNDEARHWMDDIEEFVNLSPKHLRQCVFDQVGDGTFDEDSVYNIDSYIAQNLRNEMRRENDGGLPNWIDKNIIIRAGKHGPVVEISPNNYGRR